MMLAKEPLNCDDGCTNNHFDRDDNREHDLKEARKQASSNAMRVVMNRPRIKSLNARANKAQQSKRGDWHGRLNWSRRLINFRFTRVNNRNNTWRRGSPKGTKEEQQSTCWWLLSCFPFGLSARIPALAVLKKVCQVWMDSTIIQIGFWQWSHDHYQKMKTISLMATMSHCNNVFLDDWFINQHCSKKRVLRASILMMVFIVSFSHDTGKTGNLQKNWTFWR